MRRFGVRNPVRHPDRGLAEFPPLPPAWPEPEGPHAVLLPNDGNDNDALCYRLHLHHSGPTVTALVGVLRSGAWTVHCTTEVVLPTPLDRIPMLTALAANKFYMVAVAGYILGLDMATTSFFIIELPKGVSMDDEHSGTSEWVLRDSIFLCENCNHLVEHRSEPAAGHAAVAASVAGVGDNAEFVFLELHDSCVFVYMHFSCRKVDKVYQRDPDNDEITLF
ncbi:uncharacterized protein C2845_PM12G12350 [Panicum miliaceum]|uniref:F-box protein AT5G49610-like beta-propeller domain-containing protein n=1 Tax=Panicum miliaceum TaxID=4540 RepID=A0A3L6QCQ2_PANMI|nr:uncharacterized protein C2845_PM12G12350 [Panicum miliaceum]